MWGFLLDSLKAILKGVKTEDTPMFLVGSQISGVLGFLLLFAF